MVPSTPWQSGKYNYMVAFFKQRIRIPFTCTQKAYNIKGSQHGKVEFLSFIFSNKKCKILIFCIIIIIEEEHDVIKITI